MLKECISLQAITIPESVSCIEDHAFSDCRKLNTVILLPYRIRLGKDVFSGCTEIHKLHLSERIIGFNKYTFNNPDYIYIINLPYSSIPQQLQASALKGIAYARINGETIPESIYNSYMKSINRHKDDWVYEGKIDENELFIRLLMYEKMLDADETEHLIKRVIRYNMPDLQNKLMQYQTSSFEPSDYSGLLDD